MASHETTRPSVPPAPADHVEAVLSSVQEVMEVRSRAERVTGADRASAWLLGGGYLAACLVGAWHAEVDSSDTVARLVLLVGLYVLAYRTEFVAASGSAVPTQPVLVALLLTVPVSLVPLAVLIGLHLGAAGSARSGSGLHTFVTRSIPGWHSLAPVAVLQVAAADHPGQVPWLVYALALAGQFAVDALVAVIRSLCFAVPPSHLVGPLSWTFAVDGLLAALAAPAVIVASDRLALLIPLVAAPIVLMRLLSYDRSRSVEKAAVLGTAFAQVREQARRDAITGLANRRGWNEAVQKAQALVSEDHPFVVVVADLDGLKKVNDTRGHDIGDELIVAMARLLTETAPPAGFVARLGGDEFGVLVPVPGGDADAVGACLVHLLRSAMVRHAGVHGARLSASLGFCSSPAGGDLETAVVTADLMANRDKASRRAER